MGLQRQKDIWQYAVVRDELLGLGLTGADLRDLIRKGLVDHGREVTTPSQRRRRFEKLNNLALGKRSCFVLSEQGLHELSRERSRQSDPKAPPATSQKPKWHAKNRKLWYLGRLVKWYRVPAGNQEQVLTADQPVDSLSRHGRRHRRPLGAGGIAPKNAPVRFVDDKYGAGAGITPAAHQEVFVVVQPEWMHKE